MFPWLICRTSANGSTNQVICGGSSRLPRQVFMIAAYCWLLANESPHPIPVGQQLLGKLDVVRQDDRAILFELHDLPRLPAAEVIRR